MLVDRTGELENASYPPHQLLSQFIPSRPSAIRLPQRFSSCYAHSNHMPLILRHRAMTTTLFPLPFRSNLDLRRTIITLLVYPLNDIGHIRVTETRSWYRLLYQFNPTFSAMLNTRFMRIANGPTVCIPIDPSQTTYFGKQ